MKVRESKKRQIPPSKDVLCLIDQIIKTEGTELVQLLKRFRFWRYQRGDLHSWIGVLDKFDTILADYISEYQIAQIQTKPFEPEAKELLREILRVEKILLENCTNRKLFNSYDRLYDLLNTSDIDILISALYVLLRPVQQYGNSTPFERGQGEKVLQRLLVLARGQDPLRAQGIDLKAVASDDELTFPADPKNLTASFYPTSKPEKPENASTTETPSKAQQKSPQKSGNDTSKTIDLSRLCASKWPDMYQRLADTAAETHMPLEDQYIVQNRIRWLMALGNKQERYNLLVARLLAMSAYSFMIQDELGQSSIFLYEPDLVTQMIELLSASRNTDERIQTASLIALDACSHHRTKMSEVLSGLGANLNHGVLMTLFRSISQKMNCDMPVSHELVDATVTLVAFIGASTSHVQMMIAAGLIPTLLDMLKIRIQRRDLYIPRISGLIDLVCSAPQTLPIFSNLDGVNILVAWIKREIQDFLASSLPESSDIMSQETILFYTTNPLKSVLRSVHRLMQSAGGSDSMRNLVDSDLPKSLKTIFENNGRFGTKVFSIAIGMMATFVHNEPTSLSILQELQLPQTLLTALEKQVPAVFDIMLSIPNAIGAICLNQAGLDDMMARPQVLNNYVEAAVFGLSSDVSDRENVQQLGMSLDELSRHHPTLRPIVLNAVLGLLRKCVDEGKAFVPKAEEAHDYILQEFAKSQKKPDMKSPTNEPLNLLLKVFRLLEGLCHNSTLCKEFIKEGGVTTILEAVTLPCIPIRFLNSEASMNLSNVFRVIGNTDHVKLVESLITSVQKCLPLIKPLWSDDEANQNWETLHVDPATDNLREPFDHIPGLAIRLNYLCDLFVGLGWSHTRVATALIRSLSTTSPSLVSDLSKLHRVVFREHARLLGNDTKLLGATSQVPPQATAPIVGLEDAELVTETEPVAASAEAGATQAVAGENDAGDASGVAAPTDTTAVATNDVQQTSNSAIRLMCTRVHAILTKFFKAVIKLLYVKRPDAAHIKEAAALADAIANELVLHLEAVPDHEHAVDYDTVAIGLVTILLFDDRGHEGRLNMVLFLKFHARKGIDSIIQVATRTLDYTEQHSSVDESERTEAGRKRVIRGIAGVRLLLMIFNALVSSSSLLTNPQTTVLHRSANGQELWSPLDMFLQIRLDILPHLRRIWNAYWLPTCSIALVRMAAKAFLTTVEGKNEKPPAQPAAPIANIAPNPPAPRPPAVADPTRIAQLVDMGFTRAAADFALCRARNNVAAAADMILTMPHIFLDLPDIPAPPAEDPPAAPEDAIVPGADAVQEAGASGEQVDAGQGAEAATATINPTDVPVEAEPSGSTDTSMEEPVNQRQEVVGNSTADGATATVETSNQAAEPESETQATTEAMEVDVAPVVPVKERLAALREECKPELAPRALLLLDQADDLVFDLLPAFPSGVEGATSILQHLKSAAEEIAKQPLPESDKVLKARLRLLAVFIRQEDVDKLEHTNLALAAEAFAAIMGFATINAPSRPTYTCALLVCAEATFAAGDVIRPAKLGNGITHSVIDRARELDDQVGPLSQLCLSIFNDESASREELLSAYRLLVVLSRRQLRLVDTDMLRQVLKPFSKVTANLHGSHACVAMIVRHAFEDVRSVLISMRREIRDYLTPARNKVTDISHFIKQLRPVALRDPAVFVDAVELECELVDPDPQTSVYHVKAKAEPDSIPEPGDNPFHALKTDHSDTIEVLVTELGRVVLPVASEEGVSAEEAEQNAKNAHAYAGLLISLLTELVGSYQSAKSALLASIRRQGPAEKTGKIGLSGIISNIICGVNLVEDLKQNEAKPSSESSRRLALSSWSTSLLVALCADIETPRDSQQVPEDLMTVRKSVLDAIGKSLKDLSITDPSLRYGRLWSLGELIHRLLLAPPVYPPTSSDGSSMQIAKIMLEKNFVSLLTAATGEVDLNFPGVRIVLGSLLRALDHLTKISIKWSKADKGKNAKRPRSSDTSSESDGSDVDMDDVETDEEEQAAPDLYRNSALGMIGGDIMDEDSEDEEDEEDDDDEMMEGYGDDLMDQVMEDEDSQTEPSSDDEEGEEVLDESGSEQWEDEDMDDEEEDEAADDPEVIIGEPIDDLEEEWDGIGMPPPGPAFDENNLDDEIDGYGEGLFEGDDDMDEEDEDDLDELDELEYDDIDMIDPLPTSDAAGGVPSAPGHWGWAPGPAETARPSEADPLRRMSRLLDLEAQSLFGGSPRQGPPGAADPSLITQPGPPPSASRRIPRGANSVSELFAALGDVGGPAAIQLIENLLARSSRPGHEAVRISVAQGENGQLDLSFGGRNYSFPGQGQRQGDRRSPEDILAEFVPKPTLQRWHDEARITPISYNGIWQYLINHVVNTLLPAAKQRKEEDRIKREKEEQETKEKEEKERQEQEEKEAKEKEEREKEAAAAALVELPASRATPVPPVPIESAPAAAVPSEDVEMGDVEQPAASASTITNIPAEASASTSADPSAAAETTTAATEEPAAESSTSLARTIVTIRGRDIDITDTGIDMEFLQALPEDMRLDVIEQHMNEMDRARGPPQNAPAPSTSLNSEFLDALPPDIRAEVIMHEALEAGRRGSQGGAGRGPAVPAPMPIPVGGGNAGVLPAGFLAGLDAELRGVMMMGGDGNLDDEINMDFMDMLGAPRHRQRGIRGGPTPATEVTKPARESIHLLEKPGIASLVRLLFFPEAFKKAHLFRILANLCENSTSRSDLLNLLLSVVQDGSGDLQLVDRSFQQMSLRAMATPKSTNKAKPAPETPAPISTSGLFAHLQTDNIPTFIAQRCLEALTHIVSTNSQAVNFFLTEHEQGVGLKKVSAKKGKGKEKLIPQTKFPIVILLGLLDRMTLLTTAGMMESLTALLSMITRPLANLKPDPANEEKKDEEPTEQPAAGASTGPVAPETPAVAPPPATPAAPAAKAAAGPSKTDTSTKTITRPPVIPAAVLRLVVNSLTIGECSSKNFSNALVIMQNLCYIPEAKDVLLQELRDRAQKLGSSIQDELSTLVVSLRDESFAATNPALTVFSSPTSNQAQLLRLLKTIEYLHLSKVDSDPPGDVMTEQEEAVSKAYESFDFDSMWTRLRDCLGLIEQREDTEQVSLVLLPLVESLMVVCKYRRSPSREARSPSVPPASAVSETGDLFLSFTTAHRKVLNNIVRNNPALLGGSFSLLIRNSKVLEFDNKRHWFFQKLKRKKDQAPVGTIHLNVRRQYVFEESFRILNQRSGQELKYGKLGVKFHGEDGVDAGGVTREWYSVLAQQIFDPNFALFEPCAADHQTYQPNKHSGVNDQHLSYFKFVGRIIGKAVCDGRLLDAYFNRAFYKQILGRTVDMRDLESIDPEYHKSLQWMLENDITGVIDQEFTFEDEQFGEKKIVELKTGGKDIPVTEENKEEYVRLVVSYRLDNSIKDQIKAFLGGFYEIIPRELIQIFDPDQLELLISGITTVDIDELKNATQMSGWKSSDPEINWFWRALRSFSQEERSRFLMFVTSSSRVPIGGFTQLQGASGTQPFQIQKLYGKEGSLPQASTCFNLLLLPNYTSYEQLRERMQFAVTETGGFGKA